MKFQVLQENLAAGLRTVSPAIERGAYHPPVLSNVYLQATESDHVTLAGTDLEIRLDCRVGAKKVDAPGETTVPAKLFLDLVNSLPKERVDFELNLAQSELSVQCANNKATIQCVPAEEFPLAPEFAQGSHLATLPGDVLETMTGRCLIATADRDSGRPTLTGVLMRFDGDELTMAAADGFRLSVVKEHFDGKAWEPQAVIVPAWGFSKLRIPRDEEVQIYVDTDTRIAFRMASVDLVAQAIAGKFPDYNQIVPSGYDMKTVVKTADLERVCKTARIFARLQAEIMRLEIRDDHLTVIANTDEMGGTNATIPAQVEAHGDKDRELDIAFNARFFLEALGVMSSEHVELLTTESTSPALMRPAGVEGDSFRHVLMPMSLRSMPN